MAQNFFSASQIWVTTETDTLINKVSALAEGEQFAKLQLMEDKIDQNTNFAKLPSGKWLFLYKLVVIYNY